MAYQIIPRSKGTKISNKNYYSTWHSNPLWNQRLPFIQLIYSWIHVTVVPSRGSFCRYRGTDYAKKQNKKKTENKATPNKDQSQVTKNTMLSGTCRKTLKCQRDSQYNTQLADLYQSAIFGIQWVSNVQQCNCQRVLQN